MHNSDESPAIVTTDFLPETMFKEWGQIVVKILAREGYAFEDAEDAVQTTFAKYILKVRNDGFLSGRQAYRWIERTARNEAITLYRKKKRGNFPRSQEQTISCMSADSQQLLAELDVRKKEMMQLLPELIDELPGDGSTVIREIDLNGRKQTEIAKQLRKHFSRICHIRTEAFKVLRRDYEQRGYDASSLAW